MTLAMQSRGAAVRRTKKQSSETILIAILMLAFVMPFYFFLGSLRLSMYRVYLLIFMVPFVVQWLRGAAGPVRTADVLVVLMAFWMVLALFVTEGMARTEFAVITFIETVVPYLAARVLIRDFAGFRTFVWWYFIVVMGLVPFALFENVTGKPILLDMFRGIFPVYHDADHELRMGLERAQASLPHPILLGIFAAPVFGLSWFVLGYGEPLFKRILRPFVACLAVFSSLSSGAFLGVMLQICLISWDEILKKLKSRWTLFMVIFGVLYFYVEIFSNRTIFQIIATELSFSSGTAWNRIFIFNHSIDDVQRNPIFGIGFGDWTRPHWMKASIDNFWLVLSLRHGVPSFVFLVLAILVTCVTVVRAKLTGPAAQARIGYIIVIVALCFCASTVHFWDSTYCLFMFLLGAGQWFTTGDQATDDIEGPSQDGPSNRPNPYTRFPNSKTRGAS